MSATEQAATPLPKPDRARVTEIKLEMVHTLRTVLREVSFASRSAESETAREEVEKALNKALIPSL